MNEDSDEVMFRDVTEAVLSTRCIDYCKEGNSAIRVEFNHFPHSNYVESPYLLGGRYFYIAAQSLSRITPHLFFSAVKEVVYRLYGKENILEDLLDFEYTTAEIDGTPENEIVVGQNAYTHFLLGGLCIKPCYYVGQKEFKYDSRSFEYRKIGVEIGEFCGRDGCTGTIKTGTDESSCSCHTGGAPCSHCTTSSCTKCDYKHTA